jgi:hypothetical protein
MGRSKDSGVTVDVNVDVSQLKVSLDILKDSVDSAVSDACKRIADEIVREMIAAEDRAFIDGRRVGPPPDPTAVAIRKRVKQIRSGRP